MPSRSAVVAAIGVVIGTVWASVPAVAFADGGTLYVNNAASANCSDSGASAGTQAQPYCTVQAAVDAAQPGNTVQVSQGSYGPVDIRTSGTSSAPITIIGGGASMHVPSGSSGVSLTFDHVHNVVVRGFHIGWGAAPTAVAVLGSSDVTLDSSWVVGSSELAPPPATVMVDGQSSQFTLSRSMVYPDGDASAVSLAPGANGTVLTTDVFQYDGITGQPAVTAVDAPGTVLVSNTFSSRGSCNTAISLTGSSTGSILENNAVELGANGCTYGTTTPVVIGPAAINGTKEDYDTVETASTGALFSWAGQTYSSLPEYRTASGQGDHDSSLAVTPGATTLNQIKAPLIDSADANALDEFSTDLSDRARIDDPTVTNTGTGVGYYDRGAVEYQDPLTLTATLSAAKLPTRAAETVNVSANNPWNTPIATYAFDFGDGSTPTVSTSPSASHGYTTAGNYNVKVTATSAAGATFTTQTSDLVVAPAPLIPVLKTLRTAELAVSANALSTTDAWSLTSATVDFGDGSGSVTFDPGASADHTYAQPGSYNARLTVRDAHGNTVTTTRTISVGSALVPMDPFRFLDTRSGTGAPKAKVGPGGVVRLKVAGVNGVPLTGVTAITLNLTGLNATAGTWLAAYPDGSRVPTASNLNLTPGQVTPNLVTVPVSADGYVDLYNHAGSVDLIADVEGYYSTTAPLSATPPATGFVVAQSPTRVLDTRNGTGGPKAKIGPGQAFSIHLPASVAGNSVTYGAVVLNVTETNATANSYLAVQTGLLPTTSFLNFSAGQTTSNQVVVPLHGSSVVTLRNHSGSTDIIADVQGFVMPNEDQEWGGGSPYFPVAPSRILDTRTGLGAPKAALGARSHVAVKVAGVNGIPAGVNAVLVNITGITPTAPTFISAYAEGSTLPTSSDLNLAAGSVRAVLALVPVGPDGSIDLYNAGGNVNIAADIEGYYTS